MSPAVRKNLFRHVCALQALSIQYSSYSRTSPFELSSLATVAEAGVEFLVLTLIEATTVLLSRKNELVVLH